MCSQMNIHTIQYHPDNSSARTPPPLCRIMCHFSIILWYSNTNNTNKIKVVASL